MNTRMCRNIFMLILALCVTFCLPSCTAKERLEVVSDDFPKLRYLEAGEFDESEIRLSNYSDVNINYKHAYMVSEKDGKLCISEGIDDEYQAAIKISCDNGYFVSVNVGEYDSWVEYYDYRMGWHEEFPEPVRTLVTNDHPFKFEAVDRHNMYLITYRYDPDSDSNWDPSMKTVIFKLWLPDLESDWQWEEMPETMAGDPLASFYDSESNFLYLATREGLFAYDEKGNITLYEVPDDLWGYMAITSIVRIDDMIYVGSYFGIYAQPVDGGASTWYPLSPY